MRNALVFLAASQLALHRRCLRTVAKLRFRDARAPFAAVAKRLLTVALVACIRGDGGAPAAAAEFVRDGEISVARQWTQQHFSGNVEQLPFSFLAGEESSAGLLGRATANTQTEQLDEQRTQRTLSWTDNDTGLTIEAVVVEYRDYPVVEWTVRFTNNAEHDTPILSNINAIDVKQTVPSEASTVLHHQKGSRAAPNDFEPYEMGLTMRAAAEFHSVGGRGANGSWPYFNVNWGDQGLIAALGWPGQWSARFERDGKDSLALCGGQEITHFKLRPGETARTPLAVLQWYDGDWLRGQNVWRRWMVDHNLPRPGGELPPTQLVACSSHQFGEMIHANEENQKHFIDRYLEEEFPLAYWWMDAGWYVNDGAWTTTGTWEVDKRRFPGGLRAVTDYGRSKGVKSIVWFEPERVAPGSWLYQERSQWLLAPPPNPGDQLYDPNWRLLNLGNKEALQWLIQHVNGLIDSEGIDLYRQDFNVDPLLFWLNNEPEDRRGFTENQHIQGYLAYWDALLAAHPNLRIDTCASGGRRLDLETLRRSVPLVRSDCLFEPTSQQAHSYGLSLWVPYHGTGTLVGHSAIGQHTPEGVSEYDFRSHMACSVTACWDMRDPSLDYDKLRRLTSELTQVSPLYLADFYPLTKHTLAADEWIAWQFNRPESGEAVVQAYRREKNEQSQKPLLLRGLDAAAAYRIEALGANESSTETGANLMHHGLQVTLNEPRSAQIYVLRKLQQ